MMKNAKSALAKVARKESYDFAAMKKLEEKAIARRNLKAEERRQNMKRILATVNTWVRRNFMVNFMRAINVRIRINSSVQGHG